MKLLFAVITCERFRHRADAQRTTWVPLVGDRATVRFFLAKQGREPLPDEIFLDCPDDYNSLPLKVKLMFQWALANGFQKVVKLDDDTCVHADRFLASVPQQSYVGFVNQTPPKPWCSGFAYYVDERAMRIVADAPIPAGEWAEDRFVGGVLHDAGIKPTWDRRYVLLLPPPAQRSYPYSFENVVAVCDCRDGVPRYTQAQLMELAVQSAPAPPPPPVDHSRYCQPHKIWGCPHCFRPA